MRYSRDRLEEAEFFLERLHGSLQKPREARYYFSALVSAARSISLTLQAEYRGKHGEAFNAWWEEQKSHEPVGAVSFEEVRSVRNVAQKEGNRFPQEVVVATWTEGFISDIEVRRLAFDEKKKLVKLVVNLRKDDPRNVLQVPDGAPPEDVQAAVVSHLRTNTLQAHLDEAGPASSVETRGLTLDETTGPVAVNDLLRRFEVYLGWMRGVLDDAEARFPLP